MLHPASASSCQQGPCRPANREDQCVHTLKPALIPVTVAPAKLLIFKLATFVAKDFAEASSYRFAFVLRYVGALFTVLVFYFISGLVQGQASPHLAPYGSSYFEFVLVGLALAGYLRTSMTTFAYLIRN